MGRRHLGAEWITSITQLASAYGLDETTMQQRVYALAEQIHSHYCFSRGPVNHSESRPDEHIAAGILGALAGVDWWMVKGDERMADGSAGGRYQQVHGVWVDKDDTEFTNQITGHHYRKVEGAWVRDDATEG